MLSTLLRYLELEHLDDIFWLKLERPQEHFLPGGAFQALWNQTRGESVRCRQGLQRVPPFSSRDSHTSQRGVLPEAQSNG